MRLAGAKSIAINSSFKAGATVVSTLLRVGYFIALTRLFGPELYGRYAFASSWYLLFLGFTYFGTGVYLAKEIGRNRELIARTLSATLTVKLPITALGAIACAGAAFFLENDEDVRRLLFIVSVALVGRGLAIWAEAGFNALEANVFVFRQVLAFRFLEIAGGLVALTLYGTVESVLIAHTLSWWAQAAYAMFSLHRLAPFGLVLEFAELKKICAFGAVLTVIGGLHQWLIQGAIILFRQVAADDVLVGQLAAALTIFGMLIIFPIALSTAALPVLSRTVARKDNRETVFIDIACRGIIVLGISAALVGMALGPWLIPAILGSAYTIAGDLVGPALLLVVPFGIVNVTNSVLFAHDRTKVQLLAVGAGSLIFTATLPLLSRSYGPYGPLMAMGVAGGTMSFALLLGISRVAAMDWGRSVLRPGLSAVCGVAAYLALADFSSWWALGVSFAAMAIGLVAFNVVRRDELLSCKSFARDFYRTLRQT